MLRDPKRQTLEHNANATMIEGRNQPLRRGCWRFWIRKMFKDRDTVSVSILAIIPAMVITAFVAVPNIPVPSTFKDDVSFSAFSIGVWVILCWISQLFVRPRPGRLWGWLPGAVLLLLMLAPELFMSYNREHAQGCLSRRSRVACVVGQVESIRAAMAAYTADSAGNSFPGPIANWGALTVLVNANGAALEPTKKRQGFVFKHYTPIDGDQDGIYEDYTMSFRVTDIPEQSTGSLLIVSPSGIEKTTRTPAS